MIIRSFLVALFVLVSLGLVICIWTSKISSEKKIEFTFQILTFGSLIIAGFFSYLKYVEYRCETNYQKVVDRYVDGNIDFFTNELSDYAAKATKHLEKIVSGIHDPSVQARQEAYLRIVDGSSDWRSSFHKLMVFDPIIYKAYVRLSSEIASILYSTTKDPINTQILSNQREFIEKWTWFVVFNTQDISELIREDVSRYDEPTLKPIKQSQKYLDIIERFRSFMTKWEAMVSAKRALDDSNKTNESIANTTRSKSSELEVEWNQKIRDLHNYVAEYLDKSGIETSKAVMLQEPQV